MSWLFPSGTMSNPLDFTYGGGDLLATSPMAQRNPLGAPVGDGRDAAIQGLIAYMSAIGAASAPSPNPRGFGVALAAGANAGLRAQRDAEQTEAIRDYRKLQGLQIAGSVADAQAKRTGLEQVRQLTSRPDFNPNDPMFRKQLGTILMTIPGQEATGIAMLKPEYQKLSEGDTLIDPADGRVVAGGMPKVPSGYAWTPDGALAPISGGPSDPRVIEQDAAAKARGTPVPLTERGTLVYPSFGGSSTSTPMTPFPSGAGGPNAATPGDAGRPLPTVTDVPGVGRVMQMPAPPLAEPNKVKAEADMGMLAGQRGQLRAMEQKFKPEYQETWTRLGMSSAAMREKLKIAPPNDADKAKLQEYTDFRAETSRFFNDTLKNMSGAAVTPQEYERQARNLPDPGTGFFDGDSPSEFRSKMKNNSEFLAKAQARLAYMRKNGIELGSDKMPSLDAMPQLMEARGKVIDRDLQMRQPNLSPEARRKEMLRIVAAEFGID